MVSRAHRLIVAGAAVAVGLSAVGVVAVTAMTPGGPDPVRVSADAGSLSVTLEVDDPTVGTRGARVIVLDGRGAPVPGVEVIANATMASMGHAGEVATGEPGAVGTYALAGDLFPMSGGWNVLVSIDLDGIRSTATLPVLITER